VALIRTDVSEDRIASIFRVNECEQVQSEIVSSAHYRKQILSLSCCIVLHEMYLIRWCYFHADFTKSCNSFNILSVRYIGLNV
jgi:hypothetical protein